MLITLFIYLFILTCSRDQGRPDRRTFYCCLILPSETSNPEDELLKNVQSLLYHGVQLIRKTTWKKRHKSLALHRVGTHKNQHRNSTWVVTPYFKKHRWRWQLTGRARLSQTQRGVTASTQQVITAWHGAKILYLPLSKNNSWHIHMNVLPFCCNLPLHVDIRIVVRLSKSLWFGRRLPHLVKRPNLNLQECNFPWMKVSAF